MARGPASSKELVAAFQSKGNAILGLCRQELGKGKWRGKVRGSSRLGLVMVNWIWSGESEIGEYERKRKREWALFLDTLSLRCQEGWKCPVGIGYKDWIQGSGLQERGQT